MKVQLLSFPGCPNARGAREVLTRALAAERMSVTVEEVDVTAAETPEPLRAWGSPTILIDGRDAAGATPSGSSCRLYGAAGPSRGVPSETLVRRALQNARPQRGRWLHALGAVPGALVALLPAVTCPACLGAYFGVLSALGLGVLVTNRVLVPVLAVLLALGIASIAWSSRSHDRWGPLVLTVVGSVFVTAGRLVWSIPSLLYGGAVLLIGASLWNLWLKRPRREPLVQLRLGRKGEVP